MKINLLFSVLLLTIINSVAVVAQCNLKEINEKLEKQIDDKNFGGGFEFIENFEKKCKPKKNAEYYDFLFYKAQIMQKLLKDSIAFQCIEEASNYFSQNKFQNKNYAKSVILFTSKLLERHQLDKANSILSEARIYQEQNNLVDSSTYTSTLNNLAVIHYFKSEYDEALMIFLKLFDIYKKDYKTNTDNLISCVQNIAVIYIEKGQYNISKKYLEEVLAFCNSDTKELQRKLTHIYTILGQTESRLGNIQKAKFYLFKAEELLINQSIIDSISVGGIWKILMEVCVNENNLDKALEYGFKYQNLIKSKKGMEHPSFAEACYGIGMVYFKKWEIEKSKKYINESIDVLEKSKIINKNLAEYYLGLGTIEMYNSEYYQAKNSLSKARSIMESINYQGPSYATCLNNLAVLNVQINNPEEAEVLLNKTIKVYSALFPDNHPLKVTHLTNLAQVHLKMNKLDSAKTNLLNCLKSNSLNSENNKSIANTYTALGLVYSSTNKLDSAKYCMFKSISEHEKNKSLELKYINSYYVIFNLGAIYKKENNIDSAIYYQQMAMDSSFIKFGNSNLVYFKSAVGLIELYARKNDFEKCKLVALKANDSFKKILQNFASYNSEKEVIKFIQFLEEFKNTLTSVAIQYDIDFNGLIYNIELLLKNKILETIITRNKLIKTKPKTVQDKFEKWKALKLTYINKLNLNNLSVEEEEKLLSQISSIEWSINSNFDQSEFFMGDITWDSLSQSLKSNQKNVEIIQYTNKLDGKVNTHYAAAIVGKDYIKPEMVYLCSEEALDSLFREEGIGDDLIKISQAYGNAKKNSPGKLYPLLWRKIEKYISRKDEVIIAPAGKLANINFNAIKTKNGKYVSDKYIVKLKWSTRPDHSTLNTHEPPTKAILVGGINYNSSRAMVKDSNDMFASALQRSGINEWTPLNGSKIEIDTINKICLPNNINIIILDDTTANKSNLNYILKDTSDRKFIHISTHGYFVDKVAKKSNDLVERYINIYDNPYNRCGLVLAGANSNNFEGLFSRGILLGSEIAELNLKNTDLVVLSACESGLGFSTSEGPIGLQRAFKIAGAKNIISTLWKIPDQSSSELMASFYHYYLEEKLSPSKALLQAQKDLKRKYPNPYFWAGYVVLE